MTRRGRILARALALVCAVGAAFLVVQSRPSTGAVAAANTIASAERVRTPLWSPRRMPQLFAGAAEGASLTRSLTAAVAPYDACVVVADAGGTVATVHADAPVAPASNAKLLTAAAALATFATSRTFTTRAFLDTSNDLVIVGGGDPVLATYVAPGRVGTRLDDLAAAIAGAGVRSVRSIGVDDSRYDATRLVPDWKSDYVADGEVGPLGALTVDRGFDLSGTATAAPDPALLTGTRLRTMLAAHGVSVTGGVQHMAAPAGAREVARVDSPPLGAIVEEMLRDSNNYTAEMLAREIGVAREHGGSTAAGTRAITNVDASLGVPVTGVTLHDGSGLAPDDRVTCNALAAVIALASRPRFAAINRGLPVAGRTGTLAARFRGDPLAGVLRAKTGTLDNVVALSGVIDSGVDPRFAFVANGPFTTAGGEELQARVAHVVASYPQPVDTAALVPRP